MERPRTRLRLAPPSRSLRFFERSAEFLVELFLKTCDDHIEAQDFRCKAVLSAEFLRPCNPPLPFVLRHVALGHGAMRYGAIRHGAIIRPPSPAAQCRARSQRDTADVYMTSG